MRAGKKRHFVDFQEETISADAYGAGGGSSWANVTGLTSIPCCIKPISSEEKAIYMQRQMSVSHKIETDYSSSIDEKYRIVFDSRHFDIVSLINVDEKDVMYEIIANEVK